MKHESCHFVCFTRANKESRRVRGGDSVQGCLQTVQPAQQDGAAWEQEEAEEATSSLLPGTTDDHDNHYNKEANYQSAEEETAPDAKAQEDDEGGYHDHAQAEENCQGSE